MMSFADEVMAEVRRLRILFLIRHRGSTEPLDKMRPSPWIDVEAEERRRVLSELIDEGFVEPIDRAAEHAYPPFRLSSVGEGFLRYLQERSTRETPNRFANSAAN